TDLAGADWVVFDGVRRLSILRHARRTARGPRFALFPHGSFLEEARRDALRADGVWVPSGTFRARLAFDWLLGPRILARFELIFALAEGEADDLRCFLRVPRRHIVVLPPFVSPAFLSAVEGPRSPPRVPPPYLCSVSRIDGRKNLLAALAAVDGGPYRLVVAGQDRGGLPALESEARRRPGARWEYLGTVSEDEKVSLLRSATALLLPSISEGVPAVALEALVLGTRVVLAGVTYGPDHRGVTRCRPDPSSLREAIARLPSEPPFEPLVAPTVAGATDVFLASLEAARAG
ncbi:MAG TPA: glycosyltransferase, partial [Thermoplasmata archaeon]|nr:glycosyltransferase [Thermoplasmata archaeon]